MNREFLLNATILVLANLIVKPLYVFGIEREVQDTVGASEYGLYATLYSFAFLLFMVNDFGIHYFNNRTIAQHRQLVGKWFPHILVLKAMLAVAFLVLVFVAAVFRGFETEVFYLLFFVALNHVLISLVAYLRSNISGLGHYRADSLISTLDKVLLIIVCAVLLWGGVFPGKFQIEWFVHAQNLTWALTAAVAFFLVKNQLKKPLRFRPNWPFMLVILKHSWPFALAVFLMTAYTRFDIVILEWLAPDGRHEAGVYAASYRLLDAFVMVGVLFAGLLLPMFSTMLRQPLTPKAESRDTQDATGEVVSLLRLSVQLIWAGTVSLAVACYFFQTEIMQWLYPKSVDATNAGYYGEVMGWLILTLVPFSGVFVYSSLLTANDSLRKMNRLFVACIVLNLGLNLALIPQLQAVGAAISAFATQLTVLAGLMFLAKKELALPFSQKEMARVLGFMAAVAMLSWQLYHFPNGNWLLKLAACILANLVLAFLFRLIRPSALFGLLKKGG